MIKYIIKKMIENYFINFYVKSKIFFTNLSQSISYYAYKVKEQFNFDYSNLNVKEPCDDLARLTIYEEEQIKKENNNISILEDHDLDDLDDIESKMTINQLS
jgi:hypothetical protein